jgi:hypothetical protein
MLTGNCLEASGGIDMALLAYEPGSNQSFAAP